MLMITCGIDIGSTTIEVVLLDGQVRLGAAMVRCGYTPAQNAERLLRALLESSGLTRRHVGCIVATGFGRNYFQEADKVVSEIACHAAGVRAVCPEVRTIIEIGGQDAKMVSVDERGRVRDFVMNDRCAAGTGRFVEAVARSLNMDVEETGAVGLRARQASAISSMCAVFAETEIIGLLHQGVPAGEVLKGVFRLGRPARHRNVRPNRCGRPGRFHRRGGQKRGNRPGAGNGNRPYRRRSRRTGVYRSAWSGNSGRKRRVVPTINLKKGSWTAFRNSIQHGRRRTGSRSACSDTAPVRGEREK